MNGIGVMGDFQLSRHLDGTLRFSNGTLSDVPVRVSPAFPQTDPDRWLSIRTADRTEVAMVEDPSDVSPEIRELLREELHERHFVPRVLKILQLASTTEGLKVQLQTDRGPTEIILDGDEQIRRLSDTQIVLIASDGVRFLIEDVSQLDRASRHRLERFY
jgi:hypothetical protein